MARPASHIQPVPRNHEGAQCCGVQLGLGKRKTQTIYSWKFNKMKNPTPDLLKLWFHDVFFESGVPYKQEEADYIKKIMGKK